MLRAITRITIGYILACTAAGLAMVLHVITPVELLSLTGDPLSNRLTEAASLAALASLHIAVFALPFALIAAALGEWFGWRGLVYYVLAGLAVAATGLLTQQAAELPGQATIANAYAIQAFLVAAILAGCVYWLLAGRAAGSSPATPPGPPPGPRRSGDPDDNIAVGPPAPTP
jgi:hypothetical protein